MKKTILIVALVGLALGALGVGSALAQRSQVANYGHGLMHNYMEQALAAKLDLTEKDVEAQIASGKTMYQIALDAGIAEADVPALLAEVHKTALDKAVTDGVISREQADFMLQRMASASRGYNGAGCGANGNPNGFRGGRGMMGNGWGQRQPNP